MSGEGETMRTADPRPGTPLLAAASQAGDESDQGTQPLRFHLAELLVAMTAAAALLALFRAGGIWGAVLAFGAAVLWTLVVYPKLVCSDSGRQALMFDLVWGVVMPLVCLVFDPVVFKVNRLSPFQLMGPEDSLLWTDIRGVAFLVYPLLLLQIVALLGVLLLGRLHGAWAALMTGILGVGFVTAGTLGVMLVPISTLGVLALLGLLGYTPFFTAHSYARRMRQMAGQARQSLPWQCATLWQLLGGILALLAPVGLGYALLVALRGWQALP